MHDTPWKASFVGFLLVIKSIKGLFHDLCEGAWAPLHYLLTYKFSQDHLELFFGAIRSAGGFNNNPTAQQFMAAYKCLLMRSTIEGCNGNCQKRDPTAILWVIGDTCNVNNEDITITNASLIWKYDLTERTFRRTIHSICYSQLLFYEIQCFYYDWMKDQLMCSCHF